MKWTMSPELRAEIRDGGRLPVITLIIKTPGRPTLRLWVHRGGKA